MIVLDPKLTSLIRRWDAVNICLKRLTDLQKECALWRIFGGPDTLPILAKRLKITKSDCKRHADKGCQLLRDYLFDPKIENDTLT